MDIAEFEKLERTSSDTSLGEMLSNKNDRTLIYGYTTDRLTFHLYLKDSIIHRLISDNGFLINHDKEPIAFESCVPNKRVYPDASDFEFCELLKKHNIDIPFTTFNDSRENKAFHSETAEDLKDFRVETKIINDSLKSTPLFSVNDLHLLGFSDLLLEDLPHEFIYLINKSLSNTMLTVVLNDLSEEESVLDKYLKSIPLAIKFCIDESIDNSHYGNIDKGDYTFDACESMKDHFKRRYEEIIELVNQPFPANRF